MILLALIHHHLHHYFVVVSKCSPSDSQSKREYDEAPVTCFDTNGLIGSIHLARLPQTDS